MSDGILLLRSGRHLETALVALEREFPGSRIYVVSQPGTEPHLERLGIGNDRRFIYRAGRFFTPLRFVLSATGRGLRRLCRRGVFRLVAVLWPDASGRSHLNVSLTALCLSPAGVVAVTPDGTLIRRSLWSTLRVLVPGLLGRLEVAWQRFWTAVEGAELEPRIWHSHFLSAWATERDLPALARRLSGRVVDVGAGTGYGARFLRPGATRYLPTDLPGGRDAADTAISRAGRRPGVFCSGYALPFQGGTVDGVMALSVLEHVREPSRLLDEAFRVLRPGGKVLVLTPFCFPFHGEPDDFRRWTVEGLKHELAKAGFAGFQARPIGDGLCALVLNLNLYVKYQLALSAPPPVRFCAVALRPLWFVAQAVLNTVAVVAARFDPLPRLPICVAALAEKPAPSGT